MSAMVSNANAIPATDSPARVNRTARGIDPRYWLALGICLLGCMAFRIDLPVSQWMHTRQGLKVLHQPLQISEAIGDGTGVAIILITLYVVAIERRPELLRVLCSVLASGLITNLVKLCVARLRPRSYPGEGLLEVSSVFDTFHGWLPWIQSEVVATGSKYQSFPSAHTASGFALAVALTRMFPSGSWWFGFLAVSIALQRVETGAHYVTDTCFGAAIGLVAALSFQQGTPWARWFDAYEKRPTSKATGSANDGQPDPN